MKNCLSFTPWYASYLRSCRLIPVRRNWCIAVCPWSPFVSVAMRFGSRILPALGLCVERSLNRLPTKVPSLRRLNSPSQILLCSTIELQATVTIYFGYWYWRLNYNQEYQRYLHWTEQVIHDYGHIDPRPPSVILRPKVLPRLSFLLQFTHPLQV